LATHLPASPLPAEVRRPAVSVSPTDVFPELSFAVPAGQAATVPEMFGGEFGALLLLLPGRVVPVLQQAALAARGSAL
jgi:hypothetical protein